MKDTTEDYAKHLKNNILYPFFLVYISLDGSEIIKGVQTKTALDYFRKLCMGNDKIVPELIAEFEKETRGNKRMDAYVKLLKKSMDEVKGIQEEIGLDSLATPGGTVLFANAIEQGESLELVSYVIVK